LQTARETANSALAPSALLSCVPSASSRHWSTASCAVGSMFNTAGSKLQWMFWMPFSTPLPANRATSPSRSSSASCSPVLAPEGTAARKVPSSVLRSTCTCVSVSLTYSISLTYMRTHASVSPTNFFSLMGWLWLVGSIKC